jgi:eukaryotic-like serine/threonine-protein kinase
MPVEHFRPFKPVFSAERRDVRRLRFHAFGSHGTRGGGSALPLRVTILRKLFRRAGAVFDVAMELAVDERDAYVARACAGDAALLDAVRRLLRGAALADDFLAGPAAAFAAPLLSPADIAVVPPRLGPFRVEREIGHGGMGAVYLGERDDGQFRQRVALKVVRGELGSELLVRRFLDERRILASLEHPNIARLIDGGVTPDGLPWFAMEYVDGLRLDRYCERNALALEDRLRLFGDVCRAVVYAHRMRVVHRDLKPSNILVTPEQVRGEASTAVSDVYALGVLLYELIACDARSPSEVAADRLVRSVLDPRTDTSYSVLCTRIA